MFRVAPESEKHQIALFAAAAACNLNKWDSMAAYVPLLQDDVDGAIMKTLLALQKAETADAYAEVRSLIGMMLRVCVLLLGLTVSLHVYVYSFSQNS